MRHLLLLLLLALFPFCCHAQMDVSADHWQDVYDLLAGTGDIDEDEWDEAYETLSALAAAPQNINDATIDDFRQVPFLTEVQVLSLLNYRALYGAMASMAELQLVTAIDTPRRMILNAVFYAAPPRHAPSYWADRLFTDAIDSLAVDSLRSMAAGHGSRSERMRHSVMFTMSVPCYEREGFRKGVYQGQPLSHTLRYKYQAPRVQIGLTAAQDAGEPFFKGTNAKGWDFYTGFVRVKNIGILKNAVAGHYQVTTGMGLVLNNSYRVSRQSLLSGIPSGSLVFRGHASRQENNYLQGVAATVALRAGSGEVSLSPFVSFRPLDVRFNETSDDTYGGNQIAAIIGTGYHRTETEINRRALSHQFVAGLSAAYAVLPFRVALNMVHVRLQHPLMPETNYAYRRYHPAGRDFSSASVSYSYTSPRLQISGETAVSGRSSPEPMDRRGIALSTANAFRWKVAEGWSLVALHRFYGYRFQSLLGNSFGDMHTSANENGVYLGVVTSAVSRLTLSAYIDCAYHPWLRYGYDERSRSWETYLQGVYKRGSSALTFRYRYTEKALALDGNPLPSYSSDKVASSCHAFRLVSKTVRNALTLQSQCHASYLPASSDYGLAVSQGVGYRWRTVSLWTSLAYAYTTDYAARLYLTDRTPLYAAMMTAMYGHSVRGNILMEADVSRHLSLAARFSMLRFFDRDTISSGFQTINSPWQNDIMVQMRVKF